VWWLRSIAPVSEAAPRAYSTAVRYDATTLNVVLDFEQVISELFIIIAHAYTTDGPSARWRPCNDLCQ
jgi:hypothetical protein